MGISVIAVIPNNRTSGTINSVYFFRRIWKYYFVESINNGSAFVKGNVCPHS